MDEDQIKKALATIGSPKSLQMLIKNNEVSIYRGETTAECIAKNAKRVTNAFPQLGEGFYEEFTKILIEEQLPDQRLNDAVSHVIKTIKWPSISDFLSYDRRIKLYSYDELLKMVNDTNDQKLMSRYKAVKFKGQEKAVWVLLHEYDNIKHLEE